MKYYGRAIAGLIAGWFVFALTASALQVFENASNRIGIAVAVPPWSRLSCLHWGLLSRKDSGNSPGLSIHAF